MAYVRAQLGDVTTPTGGGSGIVSQIVSWFSGTVANAGNEPQNVLDWEAQVHARGNAVVRYPKTDDIGTQGDLAEREANGTGGYSYYLAPQDVIDADRTLRGLSALAPATGKVAALGESLSSGIGANLTKIAVVTGVALVAVEVLPSLLRKR